MILYLIIIAVGFNLVAFLNGRNPAMGFAQAYINTSIAFFAVVAADVVIALIVRLIPQEKINPFASIFQSGKREKKFYKLIRVRLWKDYIPESGKYLCHFAKDEIAEPTNNEYVLKFLKETCYASLMHFISFWAGFVIALFLPVAWKISMPIMAINALLQFLPICVQRFNRPRLIALYKRNEKLYGNKDDKKVCGNVVGN